jgi:hypothetical protein
MANFWGGRLVQYRQFIMFIYMTPSRCQLPQLQLPAQITQGTFGGYLNLFEPLKRMPVYMACSNGDF